MVETREDVPQATEERIVLPCPGSLMKLLVTGERTAGRFMLAEVVERPGCRHPLHMHSREDELIYVLEGEVRVHIDGRWIACQAGEAIFLPRGREHTYAVVSHAARLLVLGVPAGLEGYYRELGQPPARHCVYQDAERMVIVAARYGIDITGPPPSPDSDS